MTHDPRVLSENGLLAPHIPMDFKDRTIEALRARLTAVEGERDALRQTLRVVACDHGNCTGGNDYQACVDCGFDWDYQKPLGYATALRAMARAALITKGPTT